MKAQDRIRLPDIGAIKRDRLPGRRLSRKIKVPAVSPDLVVEVLSESNTKKEMAAKLREYFDNGTQVAWYVQPDDQTVTVYTRAGEPDRVLGRDDVLDGGEVMPGLEIPIARLFEDLDED